MPQKKEYPHFIKCFLSLSSLPINHIPNTYIHIINFYSLTLEYVHMITQLCVGVASAARTVTQNTHIALQIGENHFYQQACQPASWELSHVGTRQETGYSTGDRNIKYWYGGVTIPNLDNQKACGRQDCRLSINLAKYA